MVVPALRLAPAPSPRAAPEPAVELLHAGGAAVEPVEQPHAEPFQPDRYAVPGPVQLHAAPDLHAGHADGRACFPGWPAPGE
jgi:hypothetical protein